MRYFLFLLMTMGGFLSFNSFAYDFSLPPVTVGTIYHDATVDSNGYFNTTWYGVPYICFNCTFNPDGKTASGTWYINDGSYDVPFPNKKPEIKPDTPQPPTDTPDIKPDIPDVKPPDITVTPPSSGGGSGGGSQQSYLSSVLSSISSSDAKYLYRGFTFHYDTSASWDSNVAVARAYLNKLTNVTPPDYYSVDRVKAMMNEWEKTYQALRPSGIRAFHWYASKFVGGEHRFTGSVVVAVNSCATPSIEGDCPDIRRPLDINDPDYASLSDYRTGITRCDRNPNDPSCHSSGGGGSGSGDSDSGGGNTDTGAKPDNCPPGSYHKPGTPEGSCTTDFNPGPEPAPNPGGGGGSGSGNTDSNDNGDVVAAINAFHADNNKNHRELMDDLNKKPADPDYTGMEGQFSSMVGGAMSGITDSVKSAWDAGKAAFGDGLSGIDSMLPDIKTSFDLPPGFEAASTGRCIPVVLDFDIKLVGIPDYHFHAVGTQVCLLYDKYIRPVLNFCMVILSFFVIHRLLVRSAEFLTDGRH
ncbi:hypothetical protein AB0R91_02190 [Salmonella enterica subsp. enterica]|uniref:hypothetical protein n=1 Tax=Salmonella enterica TaxID=28901 RepID=UPI00344E522D